MRIIFLGTGEFALPSLERLAREQQVMAVVTQPDQPAGRGRRLRPPPVKPAATALGLPVHQPERIRDQQAVLLLKGLSADLGVTAAYGQILSREVLAATRLGWVNLHPSLLPKYRGAAPIHRALMSGEQETGVTTLWMSERTDAGEIILQQKLAVDPQDNLASLQARLAERGVALLSETLRLIDKGQAPRIPQDEGQASYAPPIGKHETRIDWNAPAERIANLVRAMSPRPGAYCLRGGKVLKILKARAVKLPGQQEGTPGSIVETENGLLGVQTGDGWLLVEQVQPESRGAISAGEYLRGYRLEVGGRLE